MRGIWAASLGLGLWISVTGAPAQETQWRPTSTGSGVAIAAPQPAVGSRPAAPRPAAPAVPARGAASVVSLGQPTAASSWASVRATNDHRPTVPACLFRSPAGGAAAPGCPGQGPGYSPAHARGSRASTFGGCNGQHGPRPDAAFGPAAQEGSPAAGR